MRGNRLTQIFFVLLSFALAAPIRGQVATGTPPLGTYGGGSDVINLANLNAHFTIPVVHKAGRGMAFSYDLLYDTSVWYPVTVGTTKTWTPTANWGWGTDTQAATGYLTATVTNPTECGFWKNLGGGNQIWIVTGEIYNYSNWAYLDKFGQSHSFSGTTIHYTGTVTPCNGQDTSINVVTTDGTGFTLKATGPSGSVIARDGSVVLPQTNSGNGSATKTDSNGNQISANGSGVFTDTLGTSALTVTGGAPNPLVFTYTAPSANASYTVKFTNVAIQTNFGCSGIGEYSAASVPLVTEIDLPDYGVNSTEKYTFSYEPTYGHAGKYTGRLASVTLPTGGEISYAYGTGGTNGITCADGSASTVTRTTPDGQWTYTHSESGINWTTLATDPLGNQTNMHFLGVYETEEQSYQGSTSGTLLLTKNICYNGNTINCNTTLFSPPVSERTVFTILPGTSALQSRTNTIYDQFGQVCETDEYDFGSGAPGGLVRQTSISYAQLGSGILNHPLSVIVYDGQHNVKAQTTYSYDEGTVTATTGTPQHQNPGVGAARGNATTISYLVQGTTTLNKTYTYYDTGTVNTATDVNGAITTFNFGTGSCGNSFATSIGEPMGLNTSMTWNCAGGVKSSLSDENNKTASYTYNDPYFWRTSATTDPMSYVTNVGYTPGLAIESSLAFNGSASISDSLTTADSLGRTHVSQRKQSPTGGYDSVETDYDSLGRVSRTTLPYNGTAHQTNGTAPSFQTSYDALSRPLQITDGGGGAVSYVYTQNDAYRTLGPHPAGENTKQTQFEYDSLGRLTSVCEITSATGSGTCGQTSTATGYWTQYRYDVLGDLTSVTQNAQSSSTQTRTYVYDGLGRMTSETNPESGTTSYTYDTDTSCGTSKGDRVKKIDAVGNTVCYAYDARHRNTMITYSGLYSNNTPARKFSYDSATVNGNVMANANRRMAEAYTCVSPCTSKITDIGLSYTPRGEVSDVYESTPHSSGYYHVSQTYWANGNTNVLSGLPGLPTITYMPDGEGRVYSASASTGQNPLISTSYNFANAPTQVNLGSSDSDAFTYDPNTNRMTKYQFNVNGQSVVANLGWNAIGTLATLGITDPFNSANAQSCSYSHDELTRLSSANCGSLFSQTFSYAADSSGAFGNINKSGSSSFQPTYSYSTNHMTQIGSSNPTYDANGNVTNDFLHTYTWDANGRPVTVDTVGVTYDALGRMVEQNRNGSYTEIVYTPGGSKLALMNGQSLQKAFVKLTGDATAVYNSGGLAFYRHADWLGSSRFASTPARAMYFDGAYAPFGEPYAQLGTTDLSFTGMNQDTVSNLYDFPAREYGIQGRWPSPDPAGLPSADLTDPQTLNRYSYVRNSPLTLSDPTGMRMCAPAGCGLIDAGFGPWYGVLSAGGMDYLMGLDYGDPMFPLNSGTGGLLGGILSSILASVTPSVGNPLIIQDWKEQNGWAVGEYDGEQYCDWNGSHCQNEWWNAKTQTWENPCDGPCIGSFGPALGQAASMANDSIFKIYGLSVAAPVAWELGPVAWSAATEGYQSFQATMMIWQSAGDLGSFAEAQDVILGTTSPSIGPMSMSGYWGNLIGCMGTKCWVDWR